MKVEANLYRSPDNSYAVYVQCSMGVTEHFPLLFHNNKQTHHCYSKIKSKHGTIGVFLA
jgi:hypothetical protein